MLFRSEGDAKTAGGKFYVNPLVEQRQRERLAAWRANRDGAKAGALMDKLSQVAQGKDNIMPVMIECVEGGVTVGEVGAVLRRAFGEYQPPTVI